MRRTQLVWETSIPKSMKTLLTFWIRCYNSTHISGQRRRSFSVITYSTISELRTSTLAHSRLSSMSTRRTLNDPITMRRRAPKLKEKKFRTCRWALLKTTLNLIGLQVKHVCHFSMAKQIYLNEYMKYNLKCIVLQLMKTYRILVPKFKLKLKLDEIIYNLLIFKLKYNN